MNNRDRLADMISDIQTAFCTGESLMMDMGEGNAKEWEDDFLLPIDDILHKLNRVYDNG